MLLQDIYTSGALVAGQNVTLFARVKNIGNAKWDQSCWVSNDDFRVKFYVDGRHVGDSGWNNFDISLNGSDTFSINYTAPSSGAKNVKAIIERGRNAPTEKTTGNNARTERFTWANPAKPDLIVSSLYTDKSRYTAGENIRITSTTSNIGNKSTGYFSSPSTKFYLSRNRYLDNSDTYLDYDSMWNLGAGRSTTDTVSERLGGNLSGYYYVIAKADANNRISESNEHNNTRVGNRIYITPPSPDLLLQDIYTSGALVAGENVTLSARVKNIGNAKWDQSGWVSNDDFRVKFYVDGKHVGDSGWNNFDISVNGSDTFSINYTAPSSGAKNVKAIIERGRNAPTEKTTGNNARTERFTWANPAKPDLIVSSLYTNKSTYTAGEDIRITAATKNIGNASAGYSYTKFYLSRNTSLDSSNTYLDYDYVSSLSAGYSRSDTVSERLGGNLSGYYYVIAKADANGWRSESNEHNNIRVGPRINIVQARPDLLLQDIYTSSTLVAGENVTLSARVKNIGNAKWDQSGWVSNDDFRVKFYVDGKHVGDSGWNNFDISVNSRDTFRINYTASSSGAKSVRALIERGRNAPTEKTTGNNSRTERFTWANPAKPDLVVTSLSTNKTSYKIGESIRITSTTKNIGNAGAGYSYTKFYLSRDELLDSSDIYLDCDFVHSLDAGNWVTDTISKRLNEKLSGAYYLIAKANATGHVNESDDQNNSRVLGKFKIQAVPRKNAKQLFKDGNEYSDGKYASLAYFSNQSYKNKVDWGGWAPLLAETLNLHSKPSGSYSFHNGIYEYDGAWDPSTPRAIVARSADAVLISFRGTVSKLRDGTDWFDIPDRYEKFNTLVNAVDEYVSNDHSIKKVYVTGHSLGGGTAEEYMWNHKNYGSYGSGKNKVTYESVVFASPGTGISRNENDHSRILAIEIAGDLTPDKPTRGYLGKTFHYVPQGAGQLSPVQLCDFHSMDLYESITNKLEALDFSLGSHKHDDHVIVALKKDPIREVIDEGNNLKGDLLLYSNEDIIFGGKGDDTLEGKRKSDQLFGGPGNDTLDGGNSVLDFGRDHDVLTGGTGNDTYKVRDVRDRVIELANEGTDTVESEISYTLSANVENLSLHHNLLSDDPINGTGNNLDNRIDGNNANNDLRGMGGNDRLDGDDGDDRLFGGAGNDTYVYWRDDGSDIIDEQGFGGTDTLEIWDNSSLVDLDNFNDLRYMKSGNDLVINLDIRGALWTRDFNSGRVTIENQGTANSRVEQLKLYDDDSQLIAGTIDLTSVWNVVQRESVTSLSNLTFSSTLNSDGRYMALGVA